MADPGFPVGGGGAEPLGGGRRPPTWVLFGKNICENERIGSCWIRQCKLKCDCCCWSWCCTREGIFNRIRCKLISTMSYCHMLVHSTQSRSCTRYSQTRLIRTLLIRGENLKTLKALSLAPMLNYPLKSSPRLVHRKISAYFSDKLSGSNCIIVQ